jgi:hypothetical protein
MENVNSYASTLLLRRVGSSSRFGGCNNGNFDPSFESSRCRNTEKAAAFEVKVLSSFE